MPDQKRRVTKSKTFTGCWTCRNLKVKCDCTRPQCLRCSNSGKVCKGYDVSLTWVDVTSEWQRPTAIKRQAMSIAPAVYSNVLGARKVDAALARLDTYELEQIAGTTLDGPFGVFSTALAHSDDLITRALQTDAATLEAETCNSPTGELFPEMTALPALGPEVSQIVRQKPNVCDDDPAKKTSDQIDRVETPGSSSIQISASQNSDLRLLESVPEVLNSSARINPLAQLLLHHYVEHVAPLLQPVARSDNTYKSVHAPVALKALDALCGIVRDTHSSVAAGRVAVLFALLATSAVHLRSANGIDSRTLFHELRHQAHSNLSLALKDSSSLTLTANARSAEATLDGLENIMSASLTLVTLDVMHGDMDQFWAHLTASLRISGFLRPAADWRPRSRSMINICDFLYVISESTNWNLMPTPWDENSNTSSSAEPHFYEDGTLETTYGITATLAGLVARITRVTQAMKYYSFHHIEPPPVFQTARRHLSVALELLSIPHIESEVPKDCDANVHVLLRQHIEAFALSVKIYYHVSLYPCSTEQMDELVHEVGRTLNTIEQQKQCSGMHHAKTASIAWPGFVAACEARPGQRDQWSRWWTSMESYGIGNIKTLWEVVQKAWDVRDSGSDVAPSWLPVLMSKQKFILAV